MALFSNKHLLNPEHMKKLVGLANEAWTFFPGSLSGPVLSYTNAVVNFLDEADRRRFAESLRNVFEAIGNEPPLGEQWKRVYDSLPPDADRFAIASTMVAKSLICIDMLAAVELQFLRDGRVKRLRLQLMTEVFTALERYYGAEITVEIVLLLPRLEKAMLGPLAGD